MVLKKWDTTVHTYVTHIPSTVPHVLKRRNNKDRRVDGVMVITYLTRVTLL